MIRRTLFFIAVVLFLTLVSVDSPMGSSGMGLSFPVAARGLTAIVGLGLDEREGIFESDQSDGVTTYKGQVYQIQVSETQTPQRSIISVRIEKNSGETFRLKSFSVRVRVPRASIAGIWYPSSEVRSNNVMTTDASHPINDLADANYGIPFIAAASLNTRNVFAMGLGRQDLSVEVQGEPTDNLYYEFRLRAVTTRTAKVFEESFYASDDASMTWFDAAANYAGWVDALNGYEQFPVSQKAFEPVYDTWYWSGDRVDEHLYMQTAKFASEAGAGLYLADSGWDTPAGEYEKWLAGRTGDYNPPPDKFKDLAGTFEAMRTQYNLGVQLWLQPFAVGRSSERYARTQAMHIQLPQNFRFLSGWWGLAYKPFILPLGQNFESVNLCPRLTSTHVYLRDLFTEMAAKYKPEGYWLDFIDGMAANCVAPHDHDFPAFGEGFRRALETIKTTILSNNPEAVVHFRARYANLNNKSLANVWQSEDSPGDFDRMRLNALRLRPFSKGVVMASDQLYWPENADEVTVSKFIATSVMTGVPAFGPNLLRLPQPAIEMLEQWLGFYRMYSADLGKGRVIPFGLLRVPNHRIEGNGRTFAYVRNLDFFEMPAENATIFIINATDADRFSGRIRVPVVDATTFSVMVFNRFLAPEAGPMKASASRGVLELDVAVQQGGMVLLHAFDPNKAIGMSPLVPLPLPDHDIVPDPPDRNGGQYLLSQP